MTKRMRGKLLGVAAAAGALVSLMVPGTALAAYYGDETDYGVVLLDTPDAYGHFYTCGSDGAATACFMPYGELFLVKDTKADGHSAAADWVYTGTGGNRTGACVNQHGYGTWAVCNKSFPEGQRMRLRPAVYEGGNPITNYNWIVDTTT